MVVKIFQLCKVVLLVVCREATSHDNAAIWWTVIMLGQAGTSGEPKNEGSAYGNTKMRNPDISLLFIGKGMNF